MSIARQRREAAAGLAVLMKQKSKALEAAMLAQDVEASEHAALELALLQQNNTGFIVFVLETYAGTLAKLPGGLGKYADPHQTKTHDSLVEAVQADANYERT